MTTTGVNCHCIYLVPVRIAICLS
uniref:Uncharacterized protein n=1 Tax=Arundo donax TaxID=35708 RepID=A0A0A8YDT2_ARUDO